MLIADWFVVKLRVWHDCFSLSSETNQHLIVAGTHVRVSLVRRKKFSLGNLKDQTSVIFYLVACNFCQVGSQLWFLGTCFCLLLTFSRPEINI